MDILYPVVDLHADTPEFVMTPYRSQGNTLRHSKGHLDIPRLRAANSLVQAMAIFAPVHRLPYMPEEYRDDVYFAEVYGAFHQALVSYQEDVAPVYTYEDIARNSREGKLSLLLTLEDGAVIQGEMGRLEMLKNLGVRIITLTWNYANCLGAPNSRDPEVMAAGLTDFGREAVSRMEKLGVIVDVSHLSDGGFWDVVQLSRKPFVASHSGCRALHDHPRNLTDEMLRAIGNHGGVVGTTFCAMFLSPDEQMAHIDDIVRHMQHIREKAGIDALALGSDFDGIENQLEFGDFAGLPLLFRACEKVFTPAEMDKITHDNALRVFRECFPRDAK